MSDYKHETEKNVETDVCYCHIADGGLSVGIDKSTFIVDDEINSIKPILTFQINQYGVLTNRIELPTTPDSLKSLGEWLIKQSEEAAKWSKRSSSSHDFYFQIGERENTGDSHD